MTQTEVGPVYRPQGAVSLPTGMLPRTGCTLVGAITAPSPAARVSVPSTQQVLSHGRTAPNVPTLALDTERPEPARGEP
jgi:hypothetical protein